LGGTAGVGGGDAPRGGARRAGVVRSSYLAPPASNGSNGVGGPNGSNGVGGPNGSNGVGGPNGSNGVGGRVVGGAGRRTPRGAPCGAGLTAAEAEGWVDARLAALRGAEARGLAPRWGSAPAGEALVPAHKSGPPPPPLPFPPVLTGQVSSLLPY